MSKTLRIVKKIFIIIGILIISLIFVLALLVASWWIHFQIPVVDEERIAEFSMYVNEFEYLNDYMIKNHDCDSKTQKNSITVFFEDDTVNFYNNGKIEIDEKTVSAIEAIVPSFHNRSFDWIDITKQRISYGGLGAYMYVYSRNGKAPRYFYDKGDGIDFSSYKLTDEWYLLVSYQR